ncbi:MAG: metallophosphoesterase family protein [Thermocladium sp.]
MSLLLVSDLHKSIEPREFYAIDWLIDLIDEIKPDALISAGDWDEYVTPNDMHEVISRTALFTIYGNHENFGLIKRYAISDGSIHVVKGLRVSGVNGLIGEEEGEYIISVDRFMKVIERVKRRVDRPDIFIMHQPPYLPDQYPWMRRDRYSEVALEAINILKPRLLLNGHMTGSCYNYGKYEWGTYLRVDSSQRYRCYAVLTISDARIRVFNDNEEVLAFNI